jgi:hypothetical protein
MMKGSVRLSSVPKSTSVYNRMPKVELLDIQNEFLYRQSVKRGGTAL